MNNTLNPWLAVSLICCLPPLLAYGLVWFGYSIGKGVIQLPMISISMPKAKKVALSRVKAASPGEEK